MAQYKSAAHEYTLAKALEDIAHEQAENMHVRFQLTIFCNVS
jgi:hypothetical protein